MKTIILLFAALAAGSVCAGTYEVVTPNVEPVQMAQNQCFQTVTYDPPPQQVMVTVDPPPQTIQVAVPCPVVAATTVATTGCQCCCCDTAQPITTMVQPSVVSLPVQPATELMYSQPVPQLAPEIMYTQECVPSNLYSQPVQAEPQMVVQQQFAPQPVHQVAWQPASVCVDGNCTPVDTMTTRLATRRAVVKAYRQTR